jgi:hypothetical protein
LSRDFSPGPSAVSGPSLIGNEWISVNWAVSRQAVRAGRASIVCCRLPRARTSAGAPDFSSPASATGHSPLGRLAGGSAPCRGLFHTPSGTRGEGPHGGSSVPNPPVWPQGRGAQIRTAPDPGWPGAACFWVASSASLQSACSTGAERVARIRGGNQVMAPGEPPVRMQTRSNRRWAHECVGRVLCRLSPSSARRGPVGG